MNVYVCLCWLVSGCTQWESQCRGCQSKILFSRTTTSLLAWVSSTSFLNLKLSTADLLLYLTGIIFPPDHGPRLSLPSGEECRGVWGSTPLWPRPVGWQQRRKRSKGRSVRVSLPGVWIWGEAVCWEEDRWERDTALAHACEWQQRGEGKSKRWVGGLKRGKGKEIVGKACVELERSTDWQTCQRSSTTVCRAVVGQVCCFFT